MILHGKEFWYQNVVYFFPMHIPVFLLGFICGPVYGAAGGFLVPLLSSILTGMPAFYPMLSIMMGELLVYGFMSGMLYRRLRVPIYPTLILSMIVGRMVHGSIFALLLLAHHTQFTIGTIMADFITGIPGTLIQLVVVPALVTVILRLEGHSMGTKQEKENYLIQQSVEKIRNGECSCVVIRDGKVIAERVGNGISPVMNLLDQEPELLEGSIVVDKIIGKAAAMLFTLGHVHSVYGLVLSKAAQNYLKEQRITADYECCIDVISNRTGDGICPMERAVSTVSDAKEGYEILKQTLMKLRKAM